MADGGAPESAESTEDDISDLADEVMALADQFVAGAPTLLLLAADTSVFARAVRCCAARWSHMHDRYPCVI